MESGVGGGFDGIPQSIDAQGASDELRAIEILLSNMLVQGSLG
jgi:hypothetical protein